MDQFAGWSTKGLVLGERGARNETGRLEL